MRNPCNRLIPHGVSFVVMFGVLVLANVLAGGVGSFAPARLAIALATIAVFVALTLRRVAIYRRLDELHQRIQLESLASAFAGTFLCFVAYWLLQISGLLPPLDGMYFLLTMIALMNLGADGAWRKLARTPDAQ